MNQLSDFLNSENLERAQEMFLGPDAEPKIRIGKNWKSLGQQKLKPQQTKQLLLEILATEERERFLKEGVHEGTLHLQNHKVGYTLSLSQQGLCGHFHWLKQEARDLNFWSLPSAVSEILFRGTGLTLIIGPRRSGKSTLAETLLVEQAKRKNSVMMIFSDSEELSVPAGGSSVIYYSSTQLLKSSASSHVADLVLVDSEQPSVIREALNLAEGGSNVLMTLSAPTIQAAIERLSDLMGSTTESGLKRISHALQMALGLRGVPGLEGQSIPAIEILMATAQIKEHLRAGQWAQIEQMMYSLGEKTGMRTMNQSLLQLIIKRKIDLKMGFEESPKPDELDQLLRRVGF